VPNNQRHVNCGSRPVVPVVDVQIGAANAGAQNANFNVVDAGSGSAHLPATDRERRGFHEGFHSFLWHNDRSNQNNRGTVSQRDVPHLLIFDLMREGSSEMSGKEKRECVSVLKLWQGPLRTLPELRVARRRVSRRLRRKLRT